MCLTVTVSIGIRGIRCFLVFMHCEHAIPLLDVTSTGHGAAVCEAIEQPFPCFTEDDATF